MVLEIHFLDGPQAHPMVEIAIGELNPFGILRHPMKIRSDQEEIELSIPGEASGRDLFLQVTAEGYAEHMVSISVPLVGGLSLQSIEMRRATQGLQGRVVDQNGLPTQAELMVTNPDGSYFQDRMKSWLISYQGHFGLEQPVDERPVRVFVKHKDYVDTVYDWNTGRDDDLVIRLERGEEYKVSGLHPGRYQFRVLDIANRPLADDKVFGTRRAHDSILRLGPRAVLVEVRRPGIKKLWGSAEVGDGELRFSRAPSKR